MFLNLEIVFAMLEKVGMAALIVLSYRFIRQARFSIVRSSLATGLLFSFGAIATMLDPLVVSPGIVIDIRSVMVALAALFGGTLAALITCVVTILMRIYIGGGGVLAGSVSIVLAAAIGLAYARVSGNRRDLPGLAVLGLLLTFTLLSGLLVHAPSLLNAVPALVIRNVLGTMILGYLLAMEDKRETEYWAYKREAQRDPLTGLKNRRAFETFERQVRSQAGQEPYAVMMIDIDRFKAVNDVHGHAFGDIVLRRLAEIIVGRVRGFDLVVRYGGEEFCVLVKEATLYNAMRIAEDIRLQISEERFQVGGAVMGVTVSIGVAEASDKTASVFDIVDRADNALYDAKNGGRNRTCTFSRYETSGD